MEISNIHLGTNVKVDPSSSINNVILGNNVKIAKHCSVFGSADHLLEIGDDTYVGMFSILNGFSALLKVGRNVSIAQNVNIMTDSGPNASPLMQNVYPIIKAAVIIEDHVWIGAGVVVAPGVTIGKCSVVGANSYVCSDVQAYSLYAGNPAVFIKKINIPISEDDRKKI
jgi:acetyltransferase-like isoleucine patch superfamily enzyme